MPRPTLQTSLRCALVGFTMALATACSSEPADRPETGADDTHTEDTAVRDTEDDGESPVDGSSDADDATTDDTSTDDVADVQDTSAEDTSDARDASREDTSESDIDEPTDTSSGDVSDTEPSETSDGSTSDTSDGTNVSDPDGDTSQTDGSTDTSPSTCPDQQQDQVCTQVMTCYEKEGTCCEYNDGCPLEESATGWSQTSCDSSCIQAE